jgi:YHS domain-containing protein
MPRAMMRVAPDDPKKSTATVDTLVARSPHKQKPFPTLGCVSMDTKMNRDYDEQHQPTSTERSSLKDPVCGMMVSEQSRHKVEHNGKGFYFCSSHCLARFNAEPDKYTRLSTQAKVSSKAPSAQAAKVYTCPMHPQIRQDHPGDCPKCGMALEPVVPDLDDDENPELASFAQRFWWTLPLTVIVATLSMFGHKLGWFDMTTQSWVELVLSLPVVVWAGWPFFARGVLSVVQRSPNMWTLISLGTGAAFIYSVVATLAPGVFPPSFISMGRVAVYIVVGSELLLLTSRRFRFLGVDLRKNSYGFVIRLSCALAARLLCAASAGRTEVALFAGFVHVNLWKVPRTLRTCRVSGLGQWQWCACASVR